jgi:capsular exopolysaccharide synthesis family protein
MKMLDTPAARLDDHLVSFVAPSSFVAEQYRRLRQRIEELSLSRGVRVIAVTSAVASDGKTMTAVNLAGALAKARGSRILIVDADLRKPSVARRMGLDVPSGKGLVAALDASSGSVEGFVQQMAGSNVFVLAGTVSQTDPYELLSSARMAWLLDEARKLYDYVIVDTPPVIPVPDGGLLHRAVDGYLVVVGARSTPRKLLAEALNLLDASSVMGLVYNRDDQPLFGYYRSRYRRYFNDYVRSLDRISA